MTLSELWAMLGGPPGFHAVTRPGRTQWVPVGERRRFVASLDREPDDLEVGAVPFRSRAYNDPGASSVLWVRAGDRKARDALAAFSPSPTLVLSAGARHDAFWALSQPLSRKWTEALNRRLAHALGCKLKDGGPWFSFNPPGAVVRDGRATPLVVQVEHWDGELHSARAVAGALPDPPERRWNGA